MTNQPDQPRKSLIDYEEAINTLKGAIASLYFVSEALDSRYLEGRALIFIHETMSDAIKEIEECFEMATELVRRGTQDENL